MSTQAISPILGPMRLPFIVLTPACVLLGTATASVAIESINWIHFCIIMLGAISAHISVNAFNEYSDFKSGLDFKTEKTPFSGGSGALPQNPLKAHYALITAIITLAITISVGVFFILRVGSTILPIGVLGIFTIILYTKWITRNPIACLFAPGLGFGILMVMGTHVALAGSYSILSVYAALVPFFLVNNLLLLNQFPDVDADKSIGRNHFPIAFGMKTSMIVYGVFLLGAFGSILGGWYSGVLPLSSLFALAMLTVAIPTLVGVIKNYQNISKLLPSMTGNVILNILTPIVLAVGLFVG